ncbi:MAG: response regulator transcription factor [Pseudomonadota bacterium]
MSSAHPDLPPRTGIVADDHVMLRNGMCDLLNEHGGVDIVGQAGTGIEAISMVKQFRPTIMSLDIGMPYAQGIDVFVEARRWSPETKVIVFTGMTSHGLLGELVNAGVDGLFMKNGDLGHLIKAIPLILSGGRIISPDVTAILETVEDSPELTPRERQILSLVSRGYANREIGERLGVSAKTIDNHRTNLMRKLDVHSVAELLAYALREGLLDAQRELRP